MDLLPLHPPPAEGARGASESDSNADTLPRKTTFFGVEVYNEGNVDVYLRDVRIVWSVNGSERHIPLHRGDNTLSLLLVGEKPPKPGSLPPCKSEAWILWRNDLDPITEIVKVASDKVRVAVYSHGGEISRISGKAVLPLLVELEKAWADELWKRS